MSKERTELRREVRLKLDASSVSTFYEYFDGESLGAAVNKLLTLLIEEYEREPDTLDDVLDKMYVRLQT